MERMESAVCVSPFLFLLLSTGVYLIPDPELSFGHEEGEVTFEPWFSSVDDYVLYRVCEDGNLLLLINCSQSDGPQPDGYEVKCVNSPHYRFKMSKLTMSLTGDYRAEGWRGRNITNIKSFCLVVCAEEGEPSGQYVTYSDKVVLWRLNSPLGHWSSLQLYRYDERLKNFIRVLDTNSSLDPLVEDLKGRLQMDLNASLLTLTRFREYRDSFLCLTVWRGVQCQSYSYRKLDTRPKPVFTHEDENVTLSCITDGELPDQVYWTTPFGRVQLSNHQTHQQEVMYMLNGSQTGDYSLIIPSVTLQHSGKYRCRGSDVLNYTQLFFCSKLSPLVVTFSAGQSVHLNITEHMKNLTSPYGIQWNHGTVEKQVLILDFHSRYGNAPVSLSEDLRGRMTVSTSPSNSSLIISNLTAEDCGPYTWSVYGWGGSGRICSEGTFSLVYLDPLRVHSSVYRVYTPIGCGLLGLVAGVIWIMLRSRRREQTSRQESREGQQSDDEDLYEELERAELNTPPSAVSDRVDEHSV